MSQEHSAISLAGSLEGHLDSPAPKQNTTNGTLLISGWVFSTSIPIRKLILTINNENEEDIFYPTFRPDVGEAYPQYSNASLSGFLLDYPVQANFNGKLNLKISAIYDNDQQLCIWEQQVKVRAENSLDRFVKKVKVVKNQAIQKSTDVLFFIPRITKNIYQVWQTKGIEGIKTKIDEYVITHPITDYLLTENKRDFIYHITACEDNSRYQIWLRRNYPTTTDLQRMVRQAKILPYKPTISIILPVFNTPIDFLREAIASVLNQAYTHWELCIADDASTDSRIREILEEYQAKDPRIKVVFRSHNGHISQSSNSALEIATGEFIALLDHDDLLTLDALYEVVKLLNQHPEADMIYSDEDKIDKEGILGSPFFKPDWCPDSFLSRMYTCHLGVYRRDLVNTLGGFRTGYDGSQDYDLVLRLTEKTNKIFHIPKVLYHWRNHPASAASISTQKPYALVAAEKALLDALERRGESGKVVQAKSLTKHHIIRYTIQEYKLVSIIIPTKDLGDILDQCLTSIFEKTTYPNYEVILIDNNSQEEKTAKLINKWQDKEPDRFRSYRYDIPFNYSKINNYAVGKTKGDYLLFLNNDIEVITPDWIEAMVEQAQRPAIGAVGALLLYPDDTIQHAGVVVGLGGVAGHSHKYYPIDDPGYFDQIVTVNNYLAVTAACLMCRREVFLEVGGFEESMAVAFNDIDLCLKIFDKGYRNIYLPHAVLYHYESKSRGHEDTPEKKARFMKEVTYMRSRWKKFIDYDPCYSVNLTLNYEDYSIRTHY